MKTLALILLVAFYSAFLQPNKCSAQTDDLIHQVCRKTPYVSLCISSLQSDPRSPRADTPGLARIGIDIVTAKATATLNQIKRLIKVTREPQLKQALYDCADHYDTIVNAEMPSALEAITTGDYKFAQEGAANAALSVNYCEMNFKGAKSSPLASTNKFVHDLSVVIASIVQTLL